MQEKNQYKEERKRSMFFGGAVYVGVVIAASTLFISFVLTAFPADAYFTRVVMTVAGLMIGASMLAFPYALHVWAVTGAHRTWTTVLYYIEMLIITINTLISFGKLLSTYSGYVMPEWAILYEPFSIASIVYTMAAWGTVFLLDPTSKREAKRREFTEAFEDTVASKTLEFLHSQDGEDAIVAAASEDIAHQLARARNVRPRFGSGRGSAPAPLDASLLIKNKLDAEEPQLGKPFRSDQ
jgi:hypothetical protein